MIIYVNMLNLLWNVRLEQLVGCVHAWVWLIKRPSFETQEAQGVEIFSHTKKALAKKFSFWFRRQLLHLATKNFVAPRIVTIGNEILPWPTFANEFGWRIFSSPIYLARKSDLLRWNFFVTFYLFSCSVWQRWRQQRGLRFGRLDLDEWVCCCL